MIDDVPLANFAVRSYERAKLPYVANALKPIATVLRHEGTLSPVKRLVYGQRVEDILKKLNDIPVEDFIGQFNRIIMPFDIMWIESASPEKPKSYSLLRKGFLLARQGNGNIRCRYLMELSFNLGESLDETFELKKRRKQAEQLYRRAVYVQNNKYIAADDVEIVFTPTGIVLDDSKSESKNTRVQAGMPPVSEEHAIRRAEDIYRILVLISSRNVRVLLEETKDQDDTLGGSATKRITGKARRDTSLTPIIVDLAADLSKAIEARSGPEIKKLLGWTDVMRHRRTYHTLEGPVERIIEPYDRRIAAAVDRRGASRHITSSDPNATLDVSGDRPVLRGRKRRDLRPKN